MIIIILRGIPGSTKSTLALKLAIEYDALICSADDFHIWWGNGQYDWKFENQRFAHEQCQLRFQSCIKAGQNVIVDNTNVKLKDIEFYLNLASFRAKELKDVEIFILEPETIWRYDVEECVKKNTHNVPKETIEKMLVSLIESKKKDMELVEKYGVKFSI